MRAEADRWVFGLAGIGQPGHALWSFGTLSQTSHPFAVKRILNVREGQIVIDMDVKCGAPEEACLKMIREFQASNIQYQTMLNWRR